MKRTIIRIDRELCNGCGLCVQGCHEGALQMIDGKAVLVSDQYCDGLGACIGDCPVGAITLEEREAEPYDEKAVMQRAKTCSPPSISFAEGKNSENTLAQWPIQLHLLSPQAPFLCNAHLLLAADCVAFAMSAFHVDHLQGKRLAIACPKLDTNKEIYVEKLAAMIDGSHIQTLTVMMMEVPCCGGLLKLAQMALSRAQRKIPLKTVVVSLQGAIVA